MTKSGTDARRRELFDWRKTLVIASALCFVSSVAGEVKGQSGGASPVTYTGAVIISPADDAAVRSNAGSLTVLARVDPRLREGHRLQLLLDGIPRGAPGRKPEFHLENIDRGSHNLQLRVVDDAGGVLFTGPLSTFHLLRHSRLHRPQPSSVTNLPLGTPMHRASAVTCGERLQVLD